MDNEELGLRHFIEVILRRKWLVATATALAIVASLAFTLFQTPVYQAQTSILIEREEGLGRLLEASGDFFIDRSIRTQMELIKSRDVLSRAVIALNPNIDADQTILAIRAQRLGDAVRVSQITSTDLVTVTAKAQEPALAQARANAVAEAYVAHIVDARVESVNRALEATSNRLVQRAGDPGATQLFEQLLQVQQELELARAAGQIVGLRIVDRALLPRRPVGPRLWLNLTIGTLLGMILGTTAAFGAEYLNRKIRSDLDVKAAMGLPVLGLIPHWEIKTNPHMVTLEKDPKSAFAEAFWVLRANLQFAGVDQPLRSILVTSPAPAEGKSLIAANLARAFVLDGHRVLLLEGDLRRPTLRQGFGLPEGPGLTSILMGEEDLESCLPEIEGMDFLRAGIRPPNPAQLLGSQRMTSHLQSTEERYEMVIIDGPPVLGFADALVVGRHTGGILLVIRANFTDRDAAVEATEVLQGVNLHTLGVALNSVRPGYRGYRYRYYQKYYGADEEV